MGSAKIFRKDETVAESSLSRLLRRAGREARGVGLDTAWMALFQKASACLAAGRGGEAEAARLCQDLLTRAPGFAAGWTILGLCFGQKTAWPEARDCHRMAVRLAPDFAEGHFSLAQACEALGDTGAAIQAAQDAVARSPHFAKAWFLLGTLYNSAHRFAEALTAHEAALHVAPDLAEAQMGRGNALRGLGRMAEATDAYQAALRIKPVYPEAWSNLGDALQEQGLLDDAEAAFHTALSQDPDCAPAWRNLGALHHMRGAFEAAITAYRAALARAPEDAEIMGYIGTALNDEGRPDEAEPFFQRALTLVPENTRENASLHFNHGLARLKAGDWETGWAEHEWRWRGVMPPHGLTQPMWDGAPLEGRRILLHAEQGLGDTLHFVRYAPLVAARGGVVFLEVQKPLRRLLSGLPGVTAVLTPGEPRPEVDCHCPMMSLPFVFGTRPDTVPGAPYLTAPPDLLARWRDLIPPNTAGRKKIGLVWAGDPRPNDIRSHFIDRRRSIHLTALEPVLAACPDAAWFSLQIGPAARQDGVERLMDLTASITDFADTAALVTLLDAVVTVDTSMAHLAGALGKPVFMLSRYDGCWRWLLEGERTAWYPSMRLFRQTQPGDWREAIGGLAGAVGAFAGSS